MRKRKCIAILSMAAILSSPLFHPSNIGGAARAQEASAPAPREYKAKSPKLNRVLLDALLAKPDEILVIDVRRPDEVASIGGLPVYLGIQPKDIERNLAFIPKDRLIVTVSNHAGRAGAAADLLASHGFKVGGAAGVQDYEAEGGTLTKIVPPPRPTASVEAEKR